MPEPKRTRANGRASRRAILDTALEVFAERGHRGTTLNEVAKRVGMTQPGLLHHFATKDDLLLEVVRSREEEGSEDIRVHLTSGAPDIQRAIETLGRIKEREAVEQLLLTTLSAEAVPEEHPLHDHFVTLYRESRQGLTRALRRAQDEGLIRDDLNVADIAREIIAVIDGLRLQWLLDPNKVRLGDALSAYGRRLAAELTRGISST